MKKLILSKSDDGKFGVTPEGGLNANEAMEMLFNATLGIIQLVEDCTTTGALNKLAFFALDFCGRTKQYIVENDDAFEAEMKASLKGKS